jgi:hypothetical protein
VTFETYWRKLNEKKKITNKVLLTKEQFYNMLKQTWLLAEKHSEDMSAFDQIFGQGIRN